MELCMYIYLNFMILQPFRRLEKYPGLLKELQRHLAVSGVSYIAAILIL